MESLLQDKVEELVNYIMKKCLWQFHSRAWDRKRQNECIIAQTTQLLCGETVVPDNLADRCYWVDAVFLAEAFKKRFSWLGVMDQDGVRQLMKALHKRLDYLLITGSLNQELTDQHY